MRSELESGTPERLATALEAGLVAVRAAAAMLDETTATARPAPDEWSAAEHLAHAAVAESMIDVALLSEILAGGDGTAFGLPGGRDALFAATAELAGRPLPEIVARWEAVRSQTVDVVRRMPPDVLLTGRVAVWSAWNDGQPKTAAWVAAKACQHSWEHASAIAKLALRAPG